jgi:hypothetical protein
LRFIFLHLCGSFSSPLRLSFFTFAVLFLRLCGSFFYFVTISMNLSSPACVFFCKSDIIYYMELHFISKYGIIFCRWDYYLFDNFTRTKYGIPYKFSDITFAFFAYSVILRKIAENIANSTVFSLVFSS